MSEYEWMTEDQRECFQMLCDLFGGAHHLNKVKEFGEGIQMSSLGDFASFDYSYLTYAVFMAHDRAIRFSVAPSGPGRLKLVLHKRERTGAMNVCHPTLGAARATYMERFKKDE